MNNKFIIYLIGIYFLISPISYVFESTSFTMSYYGLLIIFIVLVVSLFSNKTIKIYSYHLLLLSWLILEMLSVIWTESFLYKSEYIVGYFNMVLVFLIITFFSYDKKQISYFLNMILSGTTLVSVYMILNPAIYRGVGFRYTVELFGRQLDPNNLSAFLIYGIWISIYKLGDTKRHRILNLLVLFINLSAVFLTGSRGGFVTIIAVVVVYFTYIFKNAKNPLRLVQRMLFIVIISTALLLILSRFIPEDLLERVISLDNYDTGSGRLGIWEKFLYYVKKKPIFGYGIGSSDIISFYATGKLIVAHNIFITLLVEVGLFGLVLFLLFIFRLLKGALRTKNILAVNFLLISIIPVLFLEGLNKRFFWNGLILTAIICNSVKNQKQSEKGQLGIEKNINTQLHF